MLPLSFYFGCLILPFTILFALANGAEPPRADIGDVQFFEAKVRPLLVEHCFNCHGTKKQNGGLRLDSGAAILAGGETGPVVVPKDPTESLLIEAINYESLKMPPDKKLSKDQIRILTQWVETGASWPDSEEGALVPRRHGLEISDEDRAYWAFRPIIRPTIPNAKETTWDDQAIDGFIYHRLILEGLHPSSAATPRELIRRTYFDLLGLPPTPEDVNKFEQEFIREPNSTFHTLVDGLLASQHYGERWGRHWLDIVRFAQTNGYERDGEKLLAWRYRDYVIKAFNEDKPYNQFIVEQLAGDEIDESTFESITATGFYRLGVWDDEPDVKDAAIYDGLDDIIRTTSEAFLGLTVGCARCHDHKFDPLSQVDYYCILSFFRNITPFGIDKSETHWQENPDAIYTPLIDKEMVAVWQAKRDEFQTELKRLEAAKGAADTETKKQLDQKIKDVQKKLKSPAYPQALSVRENSSEVEDTFVLVRGNHLTQGKKVQPRFLSVLGAKVPKVTPVSTEGEFRSLLREQGVKPTSGRRLALAKWIASPQNPLTARVIVNRLWQYHFGRGIVPTPSDFGRTGQRPSHPELLDWLASELIDNNWSLKHIHRLILNSHTYRQSSKQIPNDEIYHPQSKDPDNLLLWRQNLRRLDAEGIRDAILSVSGKLNSEMGGRGIFPKLSTGVLSSQSRPGSGWTQNQDESQRSRRSVYIFVKRTLGVPLMETLDTPTPDKPEPSRQTTTIAPQALILLNSEFIDWQAKTFAERLTMENGWHPTANITRAYQLAFGRFPNHRESVIATNFIERQEALFAKLESVPKDQVSISALIQFCRIIFNMNEFIYVD